MTRAAHVAAASLNQTVGDWEGNRRRIVAALDAARARGARLVVLPELAVSGYSLGDRVLRPGTTERAWASAKAILPHTTGLITFLGLPIRHKDALYNAVLVVADGRIVGLGAKENLATGDLEYENRWYAGWPRGLVDTWTSPDGDALPLGALVYDAVGIGRFALEVCEDAWKGNRPGSLAALAGATLIVNASASWFVLGKHTMRRRMVAQIADEDVATYVFCSLLGCDDTRMVFDGAVLITQHGEVLADADRFRLGEDHVLVDAVIDLDLTARRRAGMGSWRQQVDAATRGEYGPMPQVVEIPGDFATDRAPAAPPPYWERGTTAPPVEPTLAWLVRDGLVDAIAPEDVVHLELELALCLALHEYLRKTRINGVVLALSGGRDSAMIAVLLHRMHRILNPALPADALRAHVHDRFVCVWMETTNSGDVTRTAARAVADEVGARFYATSIQDLYDRNVALVEQAMGIDLDWSKKAHDIPLQNVQARVRGVVAWTIANLHQFLLVTTSNLSEVAVGYCTMDGDTAGGLAPIADVPKSLVGAWLVWAARKHGYTSLAHVFEAPASAELRPIADGQTDEADLMPYVVLDQLIDGFVRRGEDPLALFRSLWPALQARYGGDARAFAADIRKFVTKLCQAQWKRERFAISFRVTAFDLDPRTGYRFPVVQAPFREELDELDRYVATL